MDGSPTTKYAMNGGVHLAYQVLGAGSLDLVLVESWVHHVEAFWDVPELAPSDGGWPPWDALILSDRRGKGLSDPVRLDRLPDLETQVADTYRWPVLRFARPRAGPSFCALGCDFFRAETVSSARCGLPVTRPRRRVRQPASHGTAKPQ